MQKALQHLYKAVSGEDTSKVNISKLLVDIHQAVTGKESANKNNWSRIIDSMAENWSGGGENPNYVQVIPGTADNPWGTVDPETLADALRNNDATATMYVQNGTLGIDVTLSLKANNGTIGGYYGFVNGDGLYGVYDGVWNEFDGSGLHMFVSGTNTGFVDGSQYMPMLNTRLTIVWHPLPIGD